MHHSGCSYNENTKILSGPEETYVPDPRGIGHALYVEMMKNQHKIAQLHYASGQTETFGSLLKRCINTSMEMRKHGIKSGDIIVICAGSSLHNYVPFLAAQMTGAIAASLDPTMSQSDCEFLLRQVDVKMIFVDQQSEKLIEKVRQDIGVTCEMIVIGSTDKHTTFEAFCADRDTSNYKPYEVNDLKTTAVIVFSSGTTGLPKGICINHYGMFYEANFFVNSAYCMDVILTFASTYWVSSIVLVILTCLYGKCRCIVEKYDPKAIWTVVDKARVSLMFLAPTSAVMMLKNGRPEGVDTSSLTDLLVGGGPFSVENNLALRELLPGTNIYEVYGQSEVAGIATLFRMKNPRDVLTAREKANSVGRAITGFQIRVVDLNTENPLGPNEIGEIRFKAPGMMNGYHERDSSEAYDESGFIRSGDIGYFDEDYCFFVVDRIKEMLKFQSFHVPTAKLEGILNAHPQVATSAVIGIPDDVDGDHPMGLVILLPGATVTEDELVKYVDLQVDDRYRLRAGVKFLKSFPHTPSGKARKQELKKMILSGQ